MGLLPLYASTSLPFYASIPVYHCTPVYRVPCTECIVAPSATVEFVIQPDGFRHTMAIPITATVQHMKTAVGADLRINASHIMAFLEGAQLDDLRTLGAHGVAAGQEGVVIELQIEYVREDLGGREDERGN
jgi:hypothetical protein